jgi:prepilin-type N-terminal cleavage/methylation domain-containing protein
MSSTNNGFTLVEMSLVIVIIALIIGGIVAGADLIKGAESKQIMSEITTHQAGISSFYDKYKRLAGDMVDQSEIFDASYSDGDGNGYIEWDNGSVNEGVIAWKILQEEQFITATSDLTGTATSNKAEININVPASSRKGGYFLDTDISYSGNPPLQTGIGGTYIGYGAEVAGSKNNGGIISPIQARSIDSKMDDGMPSLGIVRGTSGSCLNGSEYAANDDQDLCSMQFLIEAHKR